MTTLEAVNEMLAAINEPPVTALDPGGTSDAGEAERWLGIESKRIQGDGWHWNTNWRYAADLPTVKIAASGGAGTFTFDETVTESSTGATGRFNYESGGSVYLVPVAGTFTGGQTLTGSTSAATRTGGTYTPLTSGRIAVNPAWVRVEPSESAPSNIIVRDGYLYDLGLPPSEDTPPTFTFTGGVVIKTVENLSFTSLPQGAAEYIVKAAALKYQRVKKRGSVDEQIAAGEVVAARARAVKENDRYRRLNLLDQPGQREMIGRNRNVYNPTYA